MKRLSVLVLFTLGLQPGCKAMVYPVARAFGSPSEAELARCREAFEAFKGTCLATRLVVFEACDPVHGDRPWTVGTSARMATGLRAHGASNAVAAPLPHGVPVRPYGGNQLRYLWERARAYGAWIREARPEGEHFLFVEVVAAPDGSVHGVQTCVVDRQGRIAYVGLMNSHHFGARPPAGPEAACDLALARLLQDLRRPPLEIFPRWGVG